MSLRRLVVVLGLATAVAACGDDDATRPETSPDPTEASPAALDLVALGDSTPTGYGLDRSDSAYTDQFAALVEQDLGVEVVVHDHATNQPRTVAEWVHVVQTNEALRGDLADAEIVTIWLGWHNTIYQAMSFSGDWSDDDRETFAALTATTPDDFDALLSSITENAPNAHVVIADGGIPLVIVERWSHEPYWPDMKQAIYLDWRDALVAAADAHDATLVQSYRALHGPTGDETPDPSLHQADDLHFNAEGHTFLAELHHTEAAVTGD